MRNHTTHPQGRDSHNLNKYIWRFIALSTAQPRVITIEATSEPGSTPAIPGWLRDGIRRPYSSGGVPCLICQITST